MGTKRIVLVAVLIALIIGAGVYVVKSGFGRGTLKAPPSVLGQKMERIDRPTLKTETLTLEEWQNLGADETGAFKNRQTGDYTMVAPISCASCGATIPEVEYPKALYKIKNMGEIKSGMAEAKSKYMCPKCGKNAYGTEGRVRRPAPTAQPSSK
jgi:hypothetical protein